MRTAIVIALAASAAFAGPETITFSEVPVGTSLDGVTINALATFHSQVQSLDAPTAETEGVPIDGPWGSGAFLIGEMGDFITIDLAVPATRAEVWFTADETIHSSFQMHLQAFGPHGNMLAFESSFPTAQGTWPASKSDSVSGVGVVEGVGEIHSIAVSFAGGPFATMFAIDNLTIETPRCNSADLVAPFGVIDFFDVARFLSDFDAGHTTADRVAPFGVFDFFDVVDYLAAVSEACP